MNSRRYVERMPSVLYGRMLMAGSLIGLSVLSWTTACHAQQSQLPRAPRNIIPTLEALPHRPIPGDAFENWCGLNAKILMRKGQGTDVYEDGVKASPLTFPTRSTLYCGDDGQKLIFDDEAAGLVYEVDIPGGIVLRTLATYNKDNLSHKISFSPDLKSVAKDQLLTLAPGAANLKVVELSGAGRRTIGRVRWNPDSSELFGVSEPEGKEKRVTVEVVSAQNQKIGSGALPKESLFRDGWFAGSQALYLYLGSSHDEFGSGVIFKCRIENWKCDRVAQNVLDASAGGNGILGIVFAVGKYSNDGDTETFPPRYRVEIRNRGGQTVAMQTFNLGERHGFGIAVAPSGKKAILTWFGRTAPGCPPEEKENFGCYEGIMIDLPENSK